MTKLNSLLKIRAEILNVGSDFLSQYPAGERSARLEGLGFRADKVLGHLPLKFYGQEQKDYSERVKSGELEDWFVAPLRMIPELSKQNKLKGDFDAVAFYVMLKENGQS